MKKQNLFYLFLILIVFNSCKKEETEIEINYASNPIQYNIDGTFLSQDKIAFLWWDGNSEKIGLFNSNTDSLVVIGTVGDLQWWQRLCFVTENTLYTFGFNENDNSMNMLYKNKLGTGNLISKSNYNTTLINLTISKNK